MPVICACMGRIDVVNTVDRPRPPPPLSARRLPRRGMVSWHIIYRISDLGVGVPFVCDSGFAFQIDLILNECWHCRRYKNQRGGTRGLSKTYIIRHGSGCMVVPFMLLAIFA